MITRIELTNFMSHANTVIEPASGLTVLTGPNNIGKSAIVAALQILCRNDNSTYVMRHGERLCSVKIDTDDGHQVEWRRRNSPSYVIDGQAFDRLRGSGLPDELHQALRMPTVDASGDDDFDIHFGTQKTPFFLLAGSPATAARFFASSSDAYRLVMMQKRHREKFAEAQRDKVRLEAELRKVNEDVGALEPVVDLEQRLTATEQTYRELVDADAWLEKADIDEAALRDCTERVAEHIAFDAVLSTVSVPPTLEDSGPLERLILAIESQRGEFDAASACVDALSNLSAAPQLAPTEPVVAIISAIDVAETQHRVAVSLMDSLGDLVSPPSLEDAPALETLTTGLAAITETTRRDASEVDRLGALPIPPNLENVALLEGLVNRLATGMAEAMAAAAWESALGKTSPLPTFVDEAPLAALVEALEKASADIEQCKLLTASLGRLSPSPTVVDTQPLVTLIRELEIRAKNGEEATSACESASANLRSVAAQIRAAAAQNVCSVCGGALDADRLIAIAATQGGEESDA